MKFLKRLVWSSVLSGFLLATFSASAGQQLCSLTFNSPDERDFLSKIYGPAHEFVPNSKDPGWLDAACLSPVRCDVLVISGHFGELFFGAKTTPTMEMSDLESRSCRNDCPSLLNAKLVFLMGCNTLATRKPDDRTSDQYLHVLVENGFPRNRAEGVVASRYSPFGLTMAERASLVFKNATSIYGFSGKSPLGPSDANILRQAALSPSESESKLDQRLLMAFKGKDFRVVKPVKELSPDVRELSCQLRSRDSRVRLSALESVFQKKDPSLFFDQVLERTNSSEMNRAWNQVDDLSIRKQFSDFMDRMFIQSRILLGIEVKILRLKSTLGFLSFDKYKAQVNNLIVDRLKAGLDYVSLDQVCEIGRSDSKLKFQSAWLGLANAVNESYYARLAGCFSQSDPTVLSALKNRSAHSLNPFTRREALRALRGKWSEGEREMLLKIASQWGMQDQVEAEESLGVPEAGFCFGLDGDSSQSRDVARWNCFKDVSHLTLRSCLATGAQFETWRGGLGVDSQCLEKFENDLSLSAAQIAASHYLKPGSQKYFPEKADDLIFNVWDRLRKKHRVNRSECLGFADSMVIEGDRIKQNWNCMNQISD